MNLVRNGLALSVLLFSTHASATLFREVENSWWFSGAPKPEKLFGYWAGRCVNAIEPDLVLPAVYLFKIVANPNHFPPQYPSQTFYWEKNAKVEIFDGMKPAELEAHPGIKAWLKLETWNQVRLSEGSLTNYYDYANRLSMGRLLRWFRDDRNQFPILRVSRWKGPIYEGTASVCFFPKFLGKTSPE